MLNVNGVIRAVSFPWCGNLFCPIKPLKLYALLTQMLLATNSNIKMAITTQIYHLKWPIRS